MEFGLGIPGFADDSHRFSHEDLTNIVQEAEEQGFHTAWLPEHIIQPSTYDFARPEPLTTLAYLAGQTSQIHLGTGILLLPLRNPVHVAKAALNIQFLSGERFELGVGLGYDEGDFQATGVDFGSRSQIFSEGISLLGELLNESSVSFSGDHYHLEDITVEPQLDNPPKIVVAGGGITRDGNRMIRRAVKERLLSVDGWIATSSATPETAKQDWDIFSEFVEKNGKDPGEYRTIVQDRTYLVAEGTSQDVRAKQREMFDRILAGNRDADWAEQHYSLGTVSEIRDSFTQYRDLGFDHLNIILPPLPYDEF